MYTLPEPEFVTATMGRDTCYAWKIEQDDVLAYGNSPDETRARFLEVAEAEGVLYRACGRVFRVTRSFTDLAAANRFMLAHPDQAVIGTRAGRVYLASIKDHGLPVAA